MRPAGSCWTNLLPALGRASGLASTPMSFQPDLVAMGHIVREHIIFPDRKTEEVLGSPAAYSSVTIARLGGRVGLVSRIGNDMPPHLLRPFREAGVDLTGLIVAAGEPTTATRLIYDQKGDKKIE